MDDQENDKQLPQGEIPAEDNQQQNQSIVEAIGTHKKVKLQNAPKDASWKILLLAGLFGIFILAGIALFLIQNTSNPNAEPTPTPTPTPVPNEPTPTPTPAPRGQRYVSYIRNDPQSNIYTVDILGNNTQKLTNNTDDRTTYSHISWKHYDQMVYVQCSVSGGECQILSRSITSGEETQVVGSNQFPPGTKILAVQYNHAGDTLAVFHQAPDKRMFATIFEEERQVLLKEFGPPVERDVTFTDEISFSFAPDDAHVAVVTTYNSPNVEPRFPTLYVFKTDDGSQLFGLGQNRFHATQPEWIDEETFYFERDEQLIEKNILTQGEIAKIGRTIDLAAAYDEMYSFEDVIIYWTQLDDGRTTLGTVDPNARRPRFVEIAPNFYKPAWYSATLVAALETRENLETEALDFVPTGRLMMVNIDNIRSYELATSGVVEFSVEPIQQ